MKHFYQITNKSFEEHEVKNYQELWEKVKTNHKGFCVSLETEFIKSAEQDNRFHVIMSNATEDRHGDIVEQNWDLKAFKKNPVFLDSHNYSSIEHIIGKVHNVKVKDKALQGDVEFMLDNPKGLLGYKMAKGGFLNATSVGFIPKEFDDKGRIIKSELLEDSAVSVPALSSALFEKTVKEVDEALEEQEDETTETEEEVVEDSSPTPPEEPETPQNPTEQEETSVGEGKTINKKLEAIKAINQREKRRQELLAESLGVIRQLQTVDDKSTRKQMVNRAIRQLLKTK